MVTRAAGAHRGRLVRLVTVHRLKVSDPYLQRIRLYEKTCEVRLDDRDYQAGDTIQFLNVDGKYAWLDRTISHVLRGGQYGIEAGYVVLSLVDDRVELLRDALAGVRAENDTLTRSNRALRARARKLTEENKR